VWVLELRLLVVLLFVESYQRDPFLSRSRWSLSCHGTPLYDDVREMKILRFQGEKMAVLYENSMVGLLCESMIERLPSSI